MIHAALIADQRDWAFEAQAHGIKKYNKPKKAGVRFDRILFNEHLDNGMMDYLESFDVLLVVGLYMYRQRKDYLDKLDIPIATVNHTAPSNSNRNNPEPYSDWKVRYGKDADSFGVINAHQRKLFEDFHSMSPRYVPNGVDLEKFPIKKPSFSEKGRIKAGWVGNPDKRCKRFDILKSAVENVEGAELITQTSTLNDYEGNRIPHEEMYTVYHDMDVYFCTSLHEGLPMPLPEAMACGLPIVTTRCGIVDEINDHSGINYLYDDDEFDDLRQQVEDTLRLWREDDGSIAQKHGYANRQEIERHWAWPHVVDSWADLVKGAHNNG